MQKTAVVTGAARGIGRAIARRLGQGGIRVVGADVDGAEMAATADALRREGLDLEGRELDVRDRVAVAAMFATVGKVEIIVNNAGVASKLLAFRDLKRADFESMFAVNVHGAFIVAQEGVRRMDAGGRVINIASRGYLGGAGASHYVASKAALVGLTRAMAIELRWSRINVNAVAPGIVDTRMNDDFTPEMKQALVSREPSGEAADPALIAECVAFLASSAAEHINGQVLMADGGKSVGVPPL